MAPLIRALLGIVWLRELPAPLSGWLLLISVGVVDLAGVRRATQPVCPVMDAQHL